MNFDTYDYISSENQCGYIYRTQKWGQNLQKMGSGYEHFHPKFELGPLKQKKKYSQIQGLLYSKEPALQHRFNEAIGKLIRVLEAEISSKKCQILAVWFGYKQC